MPRGIRVPKNAAWQFILAGKSLPHARRPQTRSLQLTNNERELSDAGGAPIGPIGSLLLLLRCTRCAAAATAAPLRPLLRLLRRLEPQETVRGANVHESTQCGSDSKW